MRKEQARYYFDLIDRHARGILYLKGYAEWLNSHNKLEGNYRDYPYKENWKQLYSGVDPVQSVFVEHIYRLNQ